MTDLHKVLREALCDFVEAQPQSFLSVVADLAPEQVRERKLLRAAAENGCLSDLLRLGGNGAEGQDETLRTLSMSLGKQVGMDPETAKQICRELILVFGEGPMQTKTAAADPEPGRTKTAPKEGRGTVSIYKPEIGDILPFGKYYQRKGSNQMEPIEWMVLDVREDRALLISRYGLDAKPYNTTKENVTWETCTLRKWLNGDFLNTAFTAVEQKRIIQTTVDNGNFQGNSAWRASGGNDTEDRIYLLSYREAEQYFSSDTGQTVQANYICGHTECMGPFGKRLLLVVASVARQQSG